MSSFNNDQVLNHKEHIRKDSCHSTDSYVDVTTYYTDNEEDNPTLDEHYDEDHNSWITIGESSQVAKNTDKQEISDLIADTKNVPTIPEMQKTDATCIALITTDNSTNSSTSLAQTKSAFLTKAQSEKQKLKSFYLLRAQAMKLRYDEMMK